MTKRVLIVIAAVIVVGAAGGWFLLRAGGTVATVNGQRIGRTDLDERVEAAVAEYQAYGLEVTEEILAELTNNKLDELIVEALLWQKATAAGIVVSDADVDDYYRQLVADSEGEEQFLAMLKEHGYTVARLRADISRHLMISRYEEAYIAENVDAAAIAVTEAEKRELYSTYAGQMEDIPPYEEVAEYLEMELREQKIYELGIIEALIEQLRVEADIEITL